MNETTLQGPHVFRDDGHLADAALSALADGQDSIVPREAVQHLDGCDACTQRLGEAALLSYAAADVLALAAVEVAPVSARSWRAPLFAIACGLAVALVAALPKLLAAPAMLRSILAALPAFARSLALIARAAGSALEDRAVIVSLVCSLVLVLVGWAIARTTPALTGASS
jgi:hypothetical protein